MNIVQTVIMFSLLAWLLPPFKQYKTKYFLYFLILAFGDPTVILLHYLFQVKYQLLAIPIHLLLITVIIRNRVYKLIIVITAIVMIFIGTYYQIGRESQIMGILVLQVIIMLIFVYDWIKYLDNKPDIPL